MLPDLLGTDKKSKKNPGEKIHLKKSLKNMSSSAIKSKVDKSNKTERNRIVSNFFFKDFERDNSELLDNLSAFHSCLCGKIKSVQKNTGRINLIHHIEAEHKDYAKTLLDAGIDLDNIARSGTPKIMSSLFKVTTTGTWVFSYLDLIINCNLPFSFLENKTARNYFNKDIGTMATNTFVKYLELVTIDVEKKIKAILPNKFGVVIDGWSNDKYHYLAMFAYINSFYFLI